MNIKKLLKNEVVLYLIFGVLTTLVYMFMRFILTDTPALLASFVSNVVAILFAFITNDTIVFKQAHTGWWPRLIKFTTARIFTMLLDMFLAWLFIDQFPNLIGQFVNHNLKLINLIESLGAQALVIILNYILSKCFVFNNKK